MGLRGPQPKPNDRRQRRNKGATVALRAVNSAPVVPEGLLKITRDRWSEYWNSDVAQAAREPHLNAIERLFKLYDERERSYRQVRRKGRLVKGSQGQYVASPLLKYIAQCDSEIRQLEDRLGLSPRGYAQLGSSFVAAQKSLDDLNQSLEHDDEPEDVDSGPDPRIQVVS